jgi:hypothetical protein
MNTKLGQRQTDMGLINCGEQISNWNTQGLRNAANDKK